MYNPTRLVWQLGESQKRDRTPQGTVWSCRVVGESFDQSVQSLAAALAKSQDHRASCGVFSFGLDRQGALADGLHGLNPRNTALFTPESKRRTALIERLLKQLVHRWKQGQLYKRINPSSALGRLCFYDELRTL